MDVLSGFPSLQFPDIPEMDEMDTEVYEHSTWLTDDPVEEEEEIENHSWFGYAAKIANDSVRALIGTEFEGSKQERDRHRRQHEAWQRELEEFEAKRQAGAFLSSRSSHSTSSVSRRSLSNHKRLKSRPINRYRKHHLAPLLKSTMSLPSGLNEHFTHTNNIAGNIGRITEAIDDDCSSNRSSDAGTMSSATASHTSSVDYNHNMINYRHYSSEQQRRRTLKKKKYSSLSRKKRRQMKIGQVSSGDSGNGNGVGVGAESSLNMRVSDMVTLLPSTTSVMVDGVISSAADDEEESFVSTDESSALVALNFCTPSSGALIDWPHHSHTFHQHHHQTIGNDDCRTVCSDSLVPCSSSYHDRSSVLIDDSSDQNALVMSHNSDDSLSGVIRRDRRSRKRVWMDDNNNPGRTNKIKRSNSYPLRSRKLTRVRNYQHGQDLGCLVVHRPLDDDGLYHHNSTTDDDNCSTPVIISSDLQSNGGESSTTNNSWCVC